jgi:hypothetical protein
MRRVLALLTVGALLALAPLAAMADDNSQGSSMGPWQGNGIDAPDGLPPAYVQGNAQGDNGH